MSHHLKKQQPLAVCYMIFDSSIAAGVLHVAALAFAEIVENIIVIPAIVIAMRLTRFAGKDNDEGLVLRRRDPALPLAAQQPMNVSAAVIKRAYFKREFDH